LTIIIIAGMRTATPPTAPTITQTARKKSEREYEIRFLRTYISKSGGKDEEEEE
jgi:hypothetical protein